MCWTMAVGHGGVGEPTPPTSPTVWGGAREGGRDVEGTEADLSLPGVGEVEGWARREREGESSDSDSSSSEEKVRQGE